MEILPTSVPLFTCVAVLVRAKSLPDIGVGDRIDSFIGISERLTVEDAVRAHDCRLLRRLVVGQQPKSPHWLFNKLTYAARAGHLDILEILSLFSTTDGLDEEGACEAAQAGASQAAGDIMTWIRDSKGDDAFATLIGEAAESDRVEVVKWLFARFPKWHKNLDIETDDTSPNESYYVNAIEGAAGNGRVELLELFHKSDTNGWTAVAMERAASRGHLEVVQWLFAHRPAQWSPWEFEGAARAGHLEIIAFAHSKIVGGLSVCADEASKSGNLHMVKWFLKHDPDTFGWYALSSAVASGNLDIVTYLHDCDVNLKDIDFFSMDSAAHHGFLNVIEWVYEHRRERCTVSGFGDAVRCGHLTTVAFLQKHGVETYRQDRVPSPFSDALAVAVEAGHFEVVKCVLERGISILSGHVVDAKKMTGSVCTASCVLDSLTVVCTPQMMDVASRKGHRVIVRYLHENRREGCTTNAMDDAACFGHLDLVKYLHEHRTEGCTTRAMDDAACYGHLDVVRYLHEHRPEGCTTRAMNTAVKYGHWDVVKFLHSNRSEGCTTDAFLAAMRAGRRDLIPWLRERLTE